MLKSILVLIFFLVLSASVQSQQIDVGVFGGYGIVKSYDGNGYSGAGAMISFKPKQALFYARVEPGVIQLEKANLFSISTTFGFDFKIGESVAISPGIGFLYRQENHYGFVLNTAFQYKGNVLNYYVKAEGVVEGWIEDSVFGPRDEGLGSIWVTVGVSRTIWLGQRD